MPALVLRSQCGPVVCPSGPARSPLDGTDVAYCRWTIQRRLLSRGVDDQLSGEVATPFQVAIPGAAVPVDLDKTTLTLRPYDERGWTVQWDGLTAAARSLVRSGFPEVVDDAMYHLSQITIVPGTSVWLTSDQAVLSDRSPSELVRSTLWLVGLRLTVAGLLFWVGWTVA